VEVLETLSVYLETDGPCEGLGAASPTAVITGDTTGSILAAFDFMEPLLKGRDPEDLNALLELVSQKLIHNTSAKAALDMALHDLYCKILQVPLWALLGGSRKTLVTDLTISLGNLDEMTTQAVKGEARGFSALKIKLGRDAESEFLTFREISRQVSCRLRIDANQGWSVKDTLRFMDRCAAEDLDVEFLEQPVHKTDLKGMAHIRKRISCPLVADESVFSPADALRVLDGECADIINVKLMKCGGIYQANRIAALAMTARCGLMLGCMMESLTGVSAALQLASSWTGLCYLDLDVPYLLKEPSSGYGFNAPGEGRLEIL